MAALATDQHGVISTPQLLALGHAKRTIWEWVEAGRLHQLHQGVYAVGHRRLSWHSRCWAAVLGAEPNETNVVVWPVVASHASAAYLWGLYRYPPEIIDVTAPIRRRAKREFRVHFSSILAEEDRSFCDDIPVTSVARTLLDLAIRLRLDRLDPLLERAEQRELLDARAIEGILDRAGGHRGRKRLRQAFAIYRPELAFTRSGLERRFLELVREAGLPHPSMNYNVAGFELDAYWEEEQFAVELDVYETHGSRAAFERDRLREDDLLFSQVETIRVTGPRLKREPRKMIERVTRHLERRRRELS
jgi:Transcriptional regulator, AbiEi antitoxin